MNIKELKPGKALNKAFLKVKPNRTEIECFKTNLIHLLDTTNEIESEEFHKNLVSDFLKKTYYDPAYFINTKGRNDLVIHNSNKPSSTVGVIIEAKSPGNRSEMLTTSKLNTKAFHEIVLYYLRERITHNNLEVKHLVITNIYEWFIFDAKLFDRIFAQNKEFVKQFNDFENGRLADITTDFFYKQIAEPFISAIQQEIEFAYFDIRNYQKPLRNNNKEDDKKLIALFKLLSPEHLLKLPFINDSNSLDKKFYSELLHIIGLSESKEGSKKLIGRNKEGERNSGAILEDAIIQLDSLDKINRLDNPSHFGDTKEERLFSVALELSITWINRVLFLKLLEAQLISYHKDDIAYSFLDSKKLKSYDDLNRLFFQVLARRFNERNEDVKKAFEKVPYLNSSLFEPTNIEHLTLFISNLNDDKTIPVISSTVLKDGHGKKLTGRLTTLDYLFRFLDAYDFSGESGEEIQEDSKTLINASVLGLIFEKINGYKDGSYFTPGFITMYMCRETIRKAVVEKFKTFCQNQDLQDVKINGIEDIYEVIPKHISRKKANEIVNSITICDPAVGSGHFLVSALNEIIAIKNDLKILEDKEGRSLSRYEITVENDELAIMDEDGKLFQYRPGSRESQRVQETLFHEKETIIENCLFGVDINPNSVKICRLRLWIELLKNAYYKNATELETLPNIDINIKCGNSLISRFAIDADLKQALKKSKWTIDSYRVAVDTYRNAESKEQKREMEQLIAGIKSDFRSEISLNDPKVKRLRKIKDELLNLTNQTSLFEKSKKEKADWNKKVNALSDEVKKLETEIEEIKGNKIYENAFEWRFEFPEVLNDEGDFVGFDVVIGNPPYVFGGNEGIKGYEKKYYKEKFETGSGKINLFTLFIEKSFILLKGAAQFAFIIPNTFLRVTSYYSSRKYLVNNSKINSIYDFGDKVFDDAVTTSIVITATTGNFDSFQTIIINDSIKRTLSKKTIIENNFVIATNLNANASILVGKLKTNVLLGSMCKEMIFGVVITKNKTEVVSNFPRDNWKPFLEGREISAYFIGEVKQWLNYDSKLLHRARTKEVFETPEKILVQRITGGTKPLKAAYDTNGLYDKESINNIILYEDAPVKTKFVLALLNSKLINWFYTTQFTNQSNLTVNLSKTYLSQIPIALPEPKANEIILMLADKILNLKKINTDTSDLENQIDQLVYQLYGLTEEEIAIVEGV